MKQALTAVVLTLAASVAKADTDCRQALALGLDVSGSVDEVEYRLQLDGLASALTDRQVQAAFLAMPEAPVRLMVFEWSGHFEQRELIGWVEPTSAEQLNAIAARLRTTASAHINDPSTAIGAAMLYGAEALAGQSECWRKTLDISGDGPANVGQHPGEIPDEQLGDIIINGLVIGPWGRSNVTKNLSNAVSLESYYRKFVLRGTGAFAEVALDYADFREAMRRKLLREIESPALSQLRLNLPDQ